MPRACVEDTVWESDVIIVTSEPAQCKMDSQLQDTIRQRAVWGSAETGTSACLSVGCNGNYIYLMHSQNKQGFFMLRMVLTITRHYFAK
jgi:hypothetical protein